MNDLHETSDWFGYTRVDFEFEGRPSLLVEPQTENPERPWIWRTEFFGHEAQLDLALLKMGWHIAYVKISDMYGAPSSIEVMRAFHEHLETEFGLASKAVLEGLSRGGLYAFNYAATFPEKVAALYLDNPVLDIRSWPGGLGEGPGSVECWEQCLEMYGLSKESASAFKGNPLDQIEPVAQARIPIVMVCGDADEVVPFEENAAILARRYEELGAPVELIVKPGFRHHPHSLPDPKPMTDFLQRHLPAAFNPSTTTEERRVVREDIEWCDVWLPHLNETSLPRVLLIGDSITRAYYGEVEKHLEGRAFVGRLSTSRSVGDPALIDEITSVLAHTNFDIIHFNNGMHGWGYSEEEYKKYFPEFVEAITKNNPDAVLVWANTTPVRTAGAIERIDERTERVKVRNQIANQYVAALDIPVNDLFCIAQLEHFSNDGVHFNTQGIEAQAKQVAAVISDLLR
jgi:hypothetical protein